MTPLSVPLQVFPFEGWVSYRAVHTDHFRLGFLRVAMAMTWISSANHHYVWNGHAIWDGGAEYVILQVVKLDPLQDILWADLVLGDTTYLTHHSPDIALQVMQIRSVWSKGFACMEHGASDSWTVNSSSGGDGKWAGGKDGQEIIEFTPCVDTASCDGSQFTTTTWG